MSEGSKIAQKTFFTTPLSQKSVFHCQKRPQNAVRASWRLYLLLAAAHGADIPGEHFLVPLDPFVVIYIVAFALAEFTTMDNPTVTALFDRNHYMQAFMVNHAGHRIERAVFGIVPFADTDQVEVLAGNRILADRMEAETACAVAPRDAASERPFKIRVVDGGEHLRQIVELALRLNRRDAALCFDRLVATID